MAQTAYLDAGGYVVGMARQDLPTPAERDALIPQISGAVSWVYGAPRGIRHKVEGSKKWQPYHQLTSGDGTELGHYTEVPHEPDPDSLRIGEYLSEPVRMEQPPLDTDWRKIGVYLSRREIAFGSYGQVTEWHWCPVVNGVVLTAQPVVIERHTYAWDPTTLVPLYRTEAISWVRNDGTEHPTTKTRIKPYDTAAKVAKEGQTRRGRLMDRVLGDLFGWSAMGAPGAPDLLTLQAFAAQPAISAARTAFVYDSSPAILTEIGAAADAWLDAEIAPGLSARNYILSQLNIYS